MKLSYQLFTSRNFSLTDTFKALADNGVPCVEGCDPLYEDVDSLVASLEEFGLTMPTGHMGVANLESDFDRYMKAADALGIELIIAPWLDEADRPKDKKGWEEFGARLGKIAERVVATGRKFAWHNHDFEFVPFPDNSLPIDAILGASEHIHSELDLAWVKVAKRDPAAELARLKDRVLSVHIKDIAPMGENADEDGWANIGHGIMDFEAISLTLKDTKVGYKVMEHDNPKDAVTFINQSVETAKKI